MMAPSIFASSYRSWEVNGRSRRMPPEKRKARSFGSPITIKAPSWARMMSSIPARSGVPGATCFSAARRVLSFRGSVRTEPRSDRLPQRPRCVPAHSATGLRAVRDEGLREAELGDLGEPPLRLAHGPEPAGEPDLAETRQACLDGHAAGRRGDRERDAEIRARLVHPHAARDVHEDVGGAERDARVPPEDGHDHREPLGVDSG